MSNVVQHFKVILTSFSSDKCNSHFKFRLSGCLQCQPTNIIIIMITISALAIKCSEQILLCELSLIVCSTSVSSHG